MGPWCCCWSTSRGTTRIDGFMTYDTTGNSAFRAPLDIPTGAAGGGCTIQDAGNGYRIGDDGAGMLTAAKLEKSGWMWIEYSIGSLDGIGARR